MGEITLATSFFRRILALELLQAPDGRSPKAAQMLAPSVDRLLADPVPLATADTRSRSALRVL
jgi:hypothetical protein